MITNLSSFFQSSIAFNDDTDKAFPSAIGFSDVSSRLFVAVIETDPAKPLESDSYIHVFNRKFINDSNFSFEHFTKIKLPIDTKIESIGCSPTEDKAYITSIGIDGVLILNTQTLKITQDKDTSAHPQPFGKVLFSHDGKKAYLTANDMSVCVYSTDVDKKLKTIQPPFAFLDDSNKWFYNPLALTWDDKTAFVGSGNVEIREINENSSSYVIDGEVDKVLTKLDGVSLIQDLSVSYDSKKLYVTHTKDDDSLFLERGIHVIDTSDFKVSDYIDLDASGSVLASNPEFPLTAIASKDIKFIDTETNKIELQYPFIVKRSAGTDFDYTQMMVMDKYGICYAIRGDGILVITKISL